MKTRRSYAVFGLGRYGLAVARELVESGAEVVAIDSNESIVNVAKTFIPICKCADVADGEVIRQLGISNIDVVIVAMASNLEASVMAITLAKEAGVKTVVAKCGNEMHQRIFKRVGADKVVFPEKESGIRLAKNLLSAGVLDIIELSKDVSMVEVGVKAIWVGKSLRELNLRKKYSLNVIAIREGNDVCLDIDPEKELSAEMTLIVVGKIEKLDKLN